MRAQAPALAAVQCSSKPSIRADFGLRPAEGGDLFWCGIRARYGGEGIRANAVNADRIRSGLLTPEMIASRSKVRGVSEHDYMRATFLAGSSGGGCRAGVSGQAQALKTTADVTTVDGATSPLRCGDKRHG